MLLLSSLLAFAAVNAVTCTNDQFRREEQIAIGCTGVSNQQQNVNLPQGGKVMITHFPAGTTNVDITLSSTEGDLDICLFDTVHNSCVHSALNCVAGYGCRIAGTNGATNVNYGGVQLTFNGDDTTNPVQESLQLTGTLNRDMWLKVLAYSRFDGQPGAYQGTITYSHDGIQGTCNPDDNETCVPCENWDCSATPGSHPRCDGSTTVTCVPCGANEMWNAATQACEAAAPTCTNVVGGRAQAWSHSNIGLTTDLFGNPSNGCCAPATPAARLTDENYCQSTGDPHIQQFDHHTNHAYINGDYWLYQGQHLSVALRHVNRGTVAGNNAFALSGPILDGHKFEFYDRDTVSRVTGGRAEGRVFIDGVEYHDTAGGQTKYQKACDFFLNKNLVCRCEWNGVALIFMINDLTQFQFKRWTSNGLGWNNAHLQVNPAYINREEDIGMCMYTATSNNEIEAGKFRVNPYPLARISCAGQHADDSEDPFTLQEGWKQGATQADPHYFCLPADEMDRRRFAERRRTAPQDEVMACQAQKANIFTMAYQICQPCSGLGNDRVINCIWDACMMDDAEMAIGEAQGCSTEVIMRAEPDQRASSCPTGTDWNARLESCLGDYDVKRSATCAGTPPAAQNKFLEECHELCQANTACAAYSFNVFTTECFIWPSCTSTVAASAEVTAYLKVTSGVILARGTSFNGDTPTGPSASYGHGGSSGSSSTVPDFSSVHSNIDDVHENVDEVNDNIDEMRLLLQQLGGSSNTLEDDVEEVHDALSELRTLIAAMSAQNGGAQNPQYNPQYNPQMSPQMNPQMNPQYNPGYNGYNPYVQPPAAQPTSSPNDDWKTVGIVSAVMSFVLLVGGVIGVSVYFCCMKKD